jgi:hypothetical protein
MVAPGRFEAVGAESLFRLAGDVDECAVLARGFTASIDGSGDGEEPAARLTVLPTSTRDDSSFLHRPINDNNS